MLFFCCFFFFFFNDTATTEIYTLSLHDALPIWNSQGRRRDRVHRDDFQFRNGDRKSTRLNSSHANISYAVFCLKKKKKTNTNKIQKKKKNKKHETKECTTTN